MGRTAPPARFAPVLLLGLAGLGAASATAQQSPTPNQGLVELDDPLGRRGVVGGNLDPLGQWADYLITPEMGEQRGGNLFFRFRRFGIASGETATFTGPDPIDGPQSVSNVIAGVTGEEPSQIDGRLRSTIPGADVWLFNPNGVVFGAGAEVDVKGSFHAGAADYVAFGEGGLERFYVDPSLPSVLATAPPAAFGFLPESHAGVLAVDRSHLEVDPGETLELVGRGLSLPDAEPGLALTGAELLAPGGHVGLEAQGEGRLTGALGDVGRERDTPGTISIRGGQIVIQEDSKVLAENDSPVTPFQPFKGRERKRRTAPGPGSIAVEAGQSLLVDDSLLSVSTHSAGNAGTIRVEAPDVRLRNGGGLLDITKGPNHPANRPHRTAEGASADTTGSGAAGLIDVRAKSLLVEKGAGLSAQTVGVNETEASGEGGTVRISGADSVLVRDRGFISVDSWAS